MDLRKRRKWIYFIRFLPSFGHDLEVQNLIGYKIGFWGKIKTP